VLVLLNPHAAYGRALRAWGTVRNELESRVGAIRVVETVCPEDTRTAVADAVDGGETAILAAGGDGTVHAVANALLATGGAREVALGAIGLGSSNDFHKPFRRDAFIGGVPVLIDCEHAEPRDVIRLSVESPEGESAILYAVLNASIGITAETNDVFNHPTSFVRAARGLSMNTAIVAAMLTTLATFHDVPCRLVVDGRDEGVRSVSNLGVIKSAHFAGSFTYDTPIEPDDGLLGVNLCERLTPFQAVATLAALGRGRFEGRPKTTTWTARRVSVVSDDAFALETDGEVEQARSVDLSVLRKGIRCCR